MFMEEYFIVFPEGDVQEIPGKLPVNGIVDINGNVLPLPLSTNRMIAYRIAGIRTKTAKGSSETYHLLELLSAEDLLEYT
ncbi:MAG: hypothetical protein LBC57_05005 [Treponema sp.]|jgi:hypothetical protein|nr:hypothetical protein [Treponema sp.]